MGIDVCTAPLQYMLSKVLVVRGRHCHVQANSGAGWPAALLPPAHHPADAAAGAVTPRAPQQPEPATAMQPRPQQPLAQQPRRFHPLYPQPKEDTFPEVMPPLSHATTKMTSVGMLTASSPVSKPADSKPADSLVRAAAANAVSTAAAAASRSQTPAESSHYPPAGSLSATLRRAAAQKVAWLRRTQADANARAWGVVDRLAAVMCRASCAGGGADYRACCPAAAATVLVVQLLLLCIEVRLFVPHATQPTLLLVWPMQPCGDGGV
jgi:hypothetical protein